MIYTGSDEIRGIMLGADEISAIYAGSEEIYPLTISGFTVKPSSLSFKKAGETKNIRVVSEYDWVASTPDNWITLGASSGASGRTTLSVTCGENQTGTELSGTVVVSTSNLTSSITINILQKNEFEPTGYIQALRSTKIDIFNPYQVYTNSGTSNYLRIEFNAQPEANGYVFQQTSGSWFSYEKSSSRSYFNIGGSTFIFSSGDWTKNTKKILTLNNGNGIAEQYSGETRTYYSSGTWNGTLPDNYVRLFPSTGSNVDVRFYWLEVYDSPEGDPIYKFYPTLDNNDVACIYDVVNNTYHYPTPDQNGTITFIPFD